MNSPIRISVSDKMRLFISHTKPSASFEKDWNGVCWNRGGGNADLGAIEVVAGKMEFESGGGGQLVVDVRVGQKSGCNREVRGRGKLWCDVMQMMCMGKW